MEMPREVTRYCRKCKKHTKHKIKEYRAAKARTLAAGTRRHERNIAGYGGKYKAIAHKKKLYKRPTFVATCTACGAKHLFSLGKRMKKLQLS